jgi:AcrR family transcriptional regulator
VTNEVGLRERKKAATRLALSQAAIRLAVERGIDQVTADAIAEAANVSPRTFHNYFSSKEDAILAAFRELAAEFVDAVHARPAGEPIWDTLRHVCATQVVGAPGTQAEAIEQARLILRTPALLAHNLALFDEMERLFAEAIAVRTGTNADTDLYPNLLSAITGAAMKAAFRVWGEGCHGADLATLVDEAFDRVHVSE